MAEPGGTGLTPSAAGARRLRRRARLGSGRLRPVPLLGRMALLAGVVVLALVLIAVARQGLLAGRGESIAVVGEAECDRRPVPVSGFRAEALRGIGLRALVDTSGRVAGVVVTGGSGDAERDSSAVAMLRGSVFTRPVRRRAPVMCLLDVRGRD